MGYSAQSDQMLLNSSKMWWKSATGNCQQPTVNSTMQSQSQWGICMALLTILDSGAEHI